MKFKLFIFVFIFLLVCFQARADVIINEVMAENAQSSKNEFIELYNTSDKSVLLDGYSLKRKTSSGSEYTLVTSSKFFGSVASHGYFVISYPDYATKIDANLVYSSNSYSFSNDNTILLYDKSGKLVDKVGFGLAKDFFETVAPNPDITKSIGRLNFSDSNNNGKDFVFNIPTPGKENEIYSMPVEKKSYSSNLQITEIYPYPYKGEEEFIELYNGSDETIDLQGWSLHDASISGEYIFPSLIIEPQKFLVLRESEYKFALNNSGNESLSIKNPNKETVFSLAYNGAKEGVSYCYNGRDWHWNKFVTPGKENIFEDLPKAKLVVDKNIYANIYASFEISGLSESEKVTWDFGDGHKSYLRKTKHKYVDVGEYEASVKYSENSEDLIENFKVNVQKFPNLKVRIIEIAANPKGNDTGKEFLTIQNKSKKKINLKNWGIATGWKKHFINHPIRKDFTIKYGKSKSITHEFSAFALNNIKAKVQLRYPDGEVAHEIKYKKEKGVKENEKYVKVKGQGWEWNESDRNENVSAEKQSTDNFQKSYNQAEENNNQKENHSDVASQHPLFTVKEIPIKKVDIEILALRNLINIELLNSVQQKFEINEINGQYLFTAQTLPEKHYIIVFWEKLSGKLNEKVNYIINLF